MAENESIGGIKVDIVGDYSSLQGDIDSAAQVAAKGGEEIAAALNTGAAGADALSSAISAAALGMGDFESQIVALENAGMTLAEALAAVQANTEALATNVGDAGAAAAVAAEQMSLFDAAIEVPYADAAGQLNLFATELEPIPAAANAAAKATEEFGQAEEEAGEQAHHAAGALGELGEKLVAFGEALAIVEGLKELGEEALHASDNITRASISLTALTGSGTKAKETIEEIEKLGIKDGLSLPALLQASTRMTNLLGASAPVPELLAKIADGAAVMGKDVGAAADSFDRLATMGSLGARQLMPLGLNLEQVAAAMNKVSGSSEASANNVKAMFKEMDQSERVEVLATALDRLSGIAQHTAEQTFGGQWQILANQWEQVMRNVGDALLPVISGLTDLMKVEVLPFLKDMSEAFNRLPAPVREAAVVVGLLAAAVVPVTLAIGGFGLAISAAAGAIAPVVGGLVTLGGALTGAGASYTAMLATGIASATVWIGLAAAIVDVAVAYTSMARAEDLAASTIAAGSKLIQEREIRLQQLGVDIAAVKDQYNQGRLSTEQYIAALTKLGDEYRKVHPVLQDHATATAGVLNTSEALRIKMAALSETVASTRDNLAKVTEKYNEHKATAQDVAAAYDKWQSATGALKTAQEALLPVVTNVHHATREFVAQTLEFPSAAKAAADATDALQIKIGAESIALAEAQRWLDHVMQAYREHNATAQDVAKALDLVNQKQSALNKTMGELPIITFKEFAAAMDKTGQSAQGTIPALERWIATLSTSQRGIKDTVSILEEMGIKITEAGDLVQNKLIRSYDELATRSITLEQESLAWGKISAAVNKLAQTDLPEALRLYDEHYAQITRAGAKEGELLATQAKRLQLEIEIDQQSGKSATSQIIALENVKLKQQALYDQTHMLGDLYVGVISDILKGWDSLGKSIADNIIEEKNWGDVFINVGKQVGKMILEDIVGTYFKALKNAILGVTVDTDGLGKTFEKLGATISKVLGGGGAKESVTSSISYAGQDAAAAGKKTMSGLGGGGGTLGAIDAVTGIGTLISSIFGNFQMARLETTMNAVEHNTRFLQIEAEQYFQVDEWARHTQLLTKLDDMWNAIRQVGQNIREAGFGIMDALGAVPQFAMGGKVPRDMLARLHGGEVVVPTSDVPLLPSLPSLPQLGALGPGAYTAAAANHTANGTFSFNIYEATDARETARQIADTMRNLSPRFAAYSS